MLNKLGQDIAAAVCPVMYQFKAIIRNPNNMHLFSSSICGLATMCGSAEPKVGGDGTCSNVSAGCRGATSKHSSTVLGYDLFPCGQLATWIPCPKDLTDLFIGSEGSARLGACYIRIGPGKSQKRDSVSLSLCFCLSISLFSLFLSVSLSLSSLSLLFHSLSLKK